MSTPLRPRTTTAFYSQTSISFAVSLGATLIGLDKLLAEQDLLHVDQH